jgi:DNA-binding response OmpR family regulator
VVDDERDNRELLEIILRWEGFVVITAATGAQALAIVAEQTPDLVLLDIMMPGMTGYEVVATMRENVVTRSTPVIVLTALEDPNARRLALSAGADDFLAKPIVRDKLLARVRAALGDGSGSASPARAS